MFRFSIFSLMLLFASSSFASSSAVGQVSQNKSGFYKAQRAKISGNRSAVVQKVKSYKPKVVK